MHDMNTDKTCPDFLASESAPASADAAFFHILPVPYEKTVSYGTGAALGPRAILEASQQLEKFDGRNMPADRGLYTHPALDCQGTGEEVLERITASVSGILEHHALPVMLGGEHTITLGALRAFVRHLSPVGVIQFDAHADLRDTYEGSHLSHACVMRRVHELGLPIVQAGVRCLSYEEDCFRRKTGIQMLDAADLHGKGLPDTFPPPGFPRDVYVTFDVDALDCGLMPATGTPEPGGLTWTQAMHLLKLIARQRHILGFDVVELAPIPRFHAADYTAAKLCYAIMGMV